MRNMTKKLKYRPKEVKVAYCFLAPSLIGVSVFVLIPFLDVLRRSFLDALGKKFIGVGNYSSVFSNYAFGLAVKNTCLFCIICIPLLLFLSLIISVVLQQIGKLRQLLRTVFLLPMAIPVASMVVLWKILFFDQGVMNHLLVTLGMNPVRWMDSGASFAMLVISYIWRNIGYFIVLWTAGLSLISESIYEAADIDGADTWQIFRYITLPNLKGTIVMNLILAFVNSFKVFREAYLVAGNYPNEHIYLLQHLFNNWFTQLNMQYISAAAVIVAIIVSIFIIVIYAWENRKEREDII